MVPDKKYFLSNNIKLAYTDCGEGDPILLIHGFASNAYINWFSTGWVEYLIKANFRVIAIDNIGHGDSDKIYVKDVYTPMNMADDAANLLKHLNINKALIMGYSMGARISGYFALKYPQMVEALIFGGLGMGMITGAGSWEPVQEALLAEDISTITNPRALMFRKFADNTKSDREALALCVVASKLELSEDAVKSIKAPTLVVVGENDDISGSAEELAAIMPNAMAVTLPGRNHMLAVGDKLYKKSVLQFITNKGKWHVTQ